MVLLILSCSGILFFSCESDSHFATGSGAGDDAGPPVTTELAVGPHATGGDWKAATGLEDLEGVWESSGGSLYEYPFRVDGMKYLRLAWRESDDTARWRSWAEKNGYDMQTLWKIRFACLSDIYGQSLPVSDANGTQYGLKLSMRDGRIYARREMLINERILLVNLGFFRISPDGDSFIENGRIRLASDRFDDLSKGGNIYRRKDGGN